TGNERFANDSYRRLIQMYGEVVDRIDGHRFEQALTDLKKSRGAAQDVDLSARDLAGLIDMYRAVYLEETGRDFPQDPREQLARRSRSQTWSKSFRLPLRSCSTRCAGSRSITATCRTSSSRSRTLSSISSRRVLPSAPPRRRSRLRSTWRTKD